MVAKPSEASRYDSRFTIHDSRSSMNPAVEFDHVTVTMQPEGTEAAFAFTAAAGEWLAFVGPNRSGKSLILKLCAGLVAPDAGRVRVPDRVGIVLQQPGLMSN